MVVLIVTKTTNYELHGVVIEAKVAAGRVPPDAVQRLKTAHDEHYQTLARLRAALNKAKIKFEETSRDSAKPWPVNRDAVITVGGDGTLLAATHQMAAGGLIVGLRSSVSSVGYLCAAGPDEVEAMVKSLLERNLVTRRVHRLAARVHKIDTGETITTEPVLNDFLYTNANPAATTRYQIRFGKATEVHRSSGIWVATAAGSTAAILAAGGQRLEADDERAQFRVRELYLLGHTRPSLAGGIFDWGTEDLEIENRCPSAILALDGQHGVVDLVYGDQIRFMPAAPIDLGRSVRA